MRKGTARGTSSPSRTPPRICLSRLRRSRAANPQGMYFCSAEVGTASLPETYSAAQKCSSNRRSRSCGFQSGGRIPLMTPSDSVCAAIDISKLNKNYFSSSCQGRFLGRINDCQVAGEGMESQRQKARRRAKPAGEPRKHFLGGYTRCVNPLPSL